LFNLIKKRWVIYKKYRNIKERYRKFLKLPKELKKEKRNRLFLKKFERLNKLETIILENFNYRLSKILKGFNKKEKEKWLLFLIGNNKKWRSFFWYLNCKRDKKKVVKKRKLKLKIRTSSNYLKDENKFLNNYEIIANKYKEKKRIYDKVSLYHKEYN